MNTADTNQVMDYSAPKDSGNGVTEDRATRRIIIGGTVAIVALFAGLGGWASFTEISSAAIASGTVIVESSSKRVQHAEGGIVGELLVQEGADVSAGDVLIRLDATKTRAELEIVQQRLFDFSVRRARLAAQRDELDDIAFPRKLLDEARIRSDGENQIKAQQRILATSRESLASQLGQITSRIAQLHDEINGLNLQSEAKAEEIAFIKDDIDRYQQLKDKNLISMTKLHDKRRQLARVKGERGRLISNAASSKGQILGLKTKSAELRANAARDTLKELNDVEADIAELIQRKIAAEDRLARIHIRAPYSGRVHELKVHTVGGVIAPGETLMMIVPDNDKLIVEAKIRPSDIDQILVGKEATVRLSAFNRRTTPELSGTVDTVSADQSKDENTGMTYYTARVRFAKGELEKLAGKPLVPGMPSEVLIKSETRTVLSYFVKPLTDQFNRAFREQ